MKKIHKNNGYVGLVFMLISVVVMAFLVWRFGVFTGNNQTQRGVQSQDLQAIQQTQILKDALEQRDRKMLQ